MEFCPSYNCPLVPDEGKCANRTHSKHFTNKVSPELRDSKTHKTWLNLIEHWPTVRQLSDRNC